MTWLITVRCGRNDNDPVVFVEWFKGTLGAAIDRAIFVSGLEPLVQITPV